MLRNCLSKEQIAMWTLGKRIAAGFALSFILLAIIGGVAYREISALVETSHTVTHTHQVMESIGKLLSTVKDAETGQRGFVITGDETFLEPYKNGLSELPEVERDLRSFISDSPSQQKRLDAVDVLIAAKLTELKKTIAMRRSTGFITTATYISAGAGKKDMNEIRRLVGQMEDEEQELLRQRAREVASTANMANETIIFGTLVCLLVVSGAAYFIIRSLSRQIGLAVQHVRSSSSELQIAANQQVSGAKESSTAMTEITATTGELSATSRQIAQSAQHVAQVAEETSAAALNGSHAVQRAHDSVGNIKSQVGVIVTYMLDLGKKSQQIGVVLDIINELAEQTNILAINATIEATGAGEAGKRFGVVADEIRKLADRVGGSTKEIRGLIEEIRTAVNTTVMATESGTKVVDLGAQQFTEVTQALLRITELLAAMNDVAREIELSTKQQSTAVEQVNVAISDVAKVSRETEVSSNQTLQTATELNRLSSELTQLIQSRG
jgi:methyl-accepting chemotaxis protein